MPRKPKTAKEATGRKNPARKSKSEAATKNEEQSASVEKKERAVSPQKKKASPQKKKVARVVVKRKTKPTYDRMIVKALRATDNDGDTPESIAAIGNYIVNNYPVNPDNYRRFLRATLKRMVASGELVQVRASFRLSARGKLKFGRRRRSASSPRKKTTKKTTDSSPKKKKKTTTGRAKKEKKEDKPKKKRVTKKADTNNKKEASPKRKKPAAPVGKRATKKSEEEKPKSPKKAKTSENNNNTSEKEKKGGEKGEKALPGSKFDHIWQYKDNGNIWGNYAVAASDVLEDVYQKYLANRGDTDVRAVKSGQWEYQVDFMAMKQTNIQHPNHTVRDIRRIANAK